MAAATVIADASVFIALAQIERLALLEGLFGRIIVPPAVAREVRPNIRELPGWAEVRSLEHVPSERVLAASLGAGETEVLCLGLETPAALVILDDLEARLRLAGEGKLRPDESGRG